MILLDLVSSSNMHTLSFQILIVKDWEGFLFWALQPVLQPVALLDYRLSCIFESLCYPLQKGSWRLNTERSGVTPYKGAFFLSVKLHEHSYCLTQLYKNDWTLVMVSGVIFDPAALKRVIIFFFQSVRANLLKKVMFTLQRCGAVTECVGVKFGPKTI